MGTIFIWLVMTVYVFTRLPWQPTLTPDSLSYIEFDPARPPGYGWLVNVYLRLHGGEGVAALGGLPFLQTGLIALALLAFARQVDRLFASRWPGVIPVLAVWVNIATFEASRWVMSEALFLPATLLGLACALAQARRGGVALLAASAASFGLAALARNIGLVLVVIPLLLALLEPGHRALPRLGRVALTVAAGGLVLAAGMLDTAARHGHVGLGSNGGISLLGKGLLLLQEAPGQDSVLAAAAGRAAAARVAITAAPNLPSRLRAQAEAYELLRWKSFMPAAEGAWPPWREGDSTARNRLAQDVAVAAIMQDPKGYAVLAARDWLSLVLLPHVWPTMLAGADSGHPFFAICRATPEECWAFPAFPLPLFYVAVHLAVSLGGVLAAVLLLAVALPRLWQGGKLPAAERVMLAFVVAIQASLLATALFEAGLWRYTIQINAMNAALLVWLLQRCLGWAGGRSLVRRFVPPARTTRS